MSDPTRVTGFTNPMRYRQRQRTISVNQLDFDAFQAGFLFGDGADGDVTISGNTTLTRDMAYNSLTINTGIVLSPAGYRIFVKGTLLNNGTIRDNGADAMGQAGGAGAVAGTMGGGSSGALAPNSSGVGAGGAGALTDGIGSAGGPGGAGTTSAGSAAGVNTRVRANRHGMMILTDTANVKGGTGGGAGGYAAGTGTGGGGGGGAGVIIIGARIIDNRNGVIEANGGNGANGVGAGAGGGGGGGGGGLVFVTSELRTGTERALAGANGAAGSGGTAGSSGTVGADLRILQLFGGRAHTH